ncbi:MAG: prepilin peptidase [Actinomycetota bacterium]|nr:prepilin peptidase [Actinomycetota bacterium]MDA2996755.1 prepilin peptidase [Actinomycetota bacterium]
MLRLVELLSFSLGAIVISFSDLRYRIIRNRDLVLLVLIGLAVNLSQDLHLNFSYLFYVTLITLALLVFFGGKIGAGDLKLFWVLSFWVPSFTKWLEGLSFSWILGGLFAISYLAFKNRRRQRNMCIPFAPFIFLGFLPTI